MTTTVFIAAIVALSAVVLLTAGFVAGWVLSPKTYTAPPEHDELAKREQRQKEWEQQQEAFKAIQSYDANTAYGVQADME